jgi:hypothetical protein
MQMMFSVFLFRKTPEGKNSLQKEMNSLLNWIPEIKFYNESDNLILLNLYKLYQNDYWKNW